MKDEKLELVPSERIRRLSIYIADLDTMKSAEQVETDIVRNMGEAIAEKLLEHGKVLMHRTLDGTQVYATVDVIVPRAAPREIPAEVLSIASRTKL